MHCCCGAGIRALGCGTPVLLTLLTPGRSTAAAAPAAATAAVPCCVQVKKAAPLEASSSSAPSQSEDIAIGKLRGEDYNFEFNGKVKDGKMHFRLFMTQVGGGGVGLGLGGGWCVRVSVCMCLGDGNKAEGLWEGVLGVRAELQPARR